MPFQDIPVDEQIGFDESDAVTARATAKVAPRPTYGQLTGYKSVQQYVLDGNSDDKGKPTGNFQPVKGDQYNAMTAEQQAKLSKTVHLDIDPRVLNEKLTFSIQRQVRMRSQEKVEGRMKPSDWATIVLPSITRVFGNEKAFFLALQNARNGVSPLYVWVDVVPSRSNPQYTTIEFKKRFNTLEELRQAQDERFAKSKNALPRAAQEAAQAVWDNLDGDQEAFMEWAHGAYPELADALLAYFVKPDAEKVDPVAALGANEE